MQELESGVCVLLSELSISYHPLPPHCTQMHKVTHFKICNVLRMTLTFIIIPVEIHLTGFACQKRYLYAQG